MVPESILDDALAQSESCGRASLGMRAVAGAQDLCLVIHHDDRQQPQWRLSGERHGGTTCHFRG